MNEQENNIEEMTTFGDESERIKDGLKTTIKVIKTQGRISLERLKEAKITKEGDIIFADVEKQKQQLNFIRKRAKFQQQCNN